MATGNTGEKRGITHPGTAGGDGTAMQSQWEMETGTYITAGGDGTAMQSQWEMETGTYTAGRDSTAM